MFGANAYGASYFGQGASSGRDVTFAATSAYGFASSARFAVGARFGAASSYRFASSAAFRAASTFRATSAYGFASVANFLSGYDVAYIVNGVNQSANIRFDSGRIRRQLNEAPNSCTFVTRNGYQPVEGATIAVYLGAVTLFSGTITAVTQTYEDTEDILRWHVTALDPTFELQARYPVGSFVNVSATTVIQSLVATYAPTFDTSAVQAALPAISVDFDGSMSLAACITLAMNLAGGGYWKPTPNRAIRAFLTDTTTPPDAIDSANTIVRDLRRAGDLTQVRNRILVTGKRTAVRLEGSTLPAGSTVIPVSDAAFFDPAGGRAKLGGRELVTYSGRSLGGGATTAKTKTTGVPQSPGAPTAAILAPGSWTQAPNVEPGAHGYGVTFVNANGDESELGATASVTVATISAPAAPTAALGYSDTAITVSSITRSGTTATATTSGAHNYATGATVVITGSVGYDGRYRIIVTGSTTFTFTVAGTPSSSSGSARLCGSGPLFGSKQYKIVHRTRGGSTLASSATSAVTASPVPQTPYVSGTIVKTTGGALTSSATYCWWTTAVTALGETAPLLEINSLGLGVSDTAVQIPLLTRVGTGHADGRLIALRIYRNLANAGTTAPRYLVAEITDPSVTTYTDRTGDTALGEQALTEDRSGGGSVILTGIPTSGDARVIGRDIYRLAPDGQYRYAGKIGNNTDTTWTDYVDDLDLGDPEPTIDEASVGEVALSNIPTGPAGTVVVNGVTVNLTKARRIYRTPAGGSKYQFLKTLDDNTTTTLTDNTSDNSLGKEPPPFSEWRVRAGSTTLRVADLAAVPASGFVIASGQLITYTGRSASSGEGQLTGVPTSGFGAITTDVVASDTGTALPYVTLASGTAYAVKDGDELAIYAERNDVAAQTALGSVREFPIANDDWTTIAQLNAAGDAELASNAVKQLSITYATRDVKSVEGKQVTVNRTGITGTFTLQTVDISELGVIPRTYPRFSVEAGPTKFTLQDLLKRIGA